MLFLCWHQQWWHSEARPAYCTSFCQAIARPSQLAHASVQGLTAHRWPPDSFTCNFSVKFIVTSIFHKCGDWDSERQTNFVNITKYVMLEPNADLGLHNAKISTLKHTCHGLSLKWCLKNFSLHKRVTPEYGRQIIFVSQTLAQSRCSMLIALMTCLPRSTIVVALSSSLVPYFSLTTIRIIHIRKHSITISFYFQELYI